LSQEVRSKR